MAECVEFEVIGGPMDGLRCCLAGPGTAGRKVGNALSLALDDQVSGRHLEIVREGHDWCVRDLGSTNGTYLASQRLSPDRSYPLKNGDVLLLGSTVLLFTLAQEGAAPLVFGGLNFEDPRSRYPMTAELAQVWERLFTALADEATPNRLYCDVDRFFLALMTQIRGGSGVVYDCERRAAAPDRYQILAKWLHDVPVERAFRGDPGTLTVAPRLWRLLDLAGEERQEVIGIKESLAALIKEGRSLAARYISQDPRFLETYREAMQQNATDAAVIEAFRGTQPEQAPPPVATVTSSPAEGRPTLLRPAATPSPQPAAGCEEIWKTFGQRLEVLVTGFLADALNPVASRQEVRPPGLERRLSEALVSPQELKHHLDALYNLLVVILASQRDGYKAFGEHLLLTLEHAAAEMKDNRGLGLPIGKKGIAADEWTIKMKTLLGRLESEGASETIIRDIIRKKIQQLAI